MNRRDTKLTDAAVDALPIHGGRTELLEEIMSTAADDTEPVHAAAGRRHARYLVPLAAAAAVAALATGPLWWGGGSEPSGTGADQSAVAPAADPADGTGDFPLLEAAGWSVEDAGSDEYGVEVDFVGPDGASFQANSRDADLYDEYVADREDIVRPPAPGDPVEAVGLPGQLWSYSREDHTVIREVEGETYWEFRGGGMRESAFIDLLAQVRLVGAEEFEAALPDEFVTTAERPAALEEISDGISAELGELGLTPEGTTVDLGSGALDRYDLGARIAGAVACAWLDSYVTARQEGDDAAADDAVAAMATSREWPILQEMLEEGAYPEVLWQYADAVAAGTDPAGYRGALGCP